jgi:hypothetical protein
MRFLTLFVDFILPPFLWLAATVFIWAAFFGLSRALFYRQWTGFLIGLGIWVITIVLKGWIVDWRPSFSRSLFLSIRYGAAEGHKRSTHYDH